MIYQATCNRVKSNVARVIVVLSLFVLTACNPTDDRNGAAPDATADIPKPDWSASLDISGGFAGMMRTVTIDHTGHAILIDNKRKSRVEKQVTPQDLQTYAELVKILPVGKATETKLGNCRDCITYTLVTSFAGNKHQMKTDNIGLQGSDAKALIQMLVALASDMSKQNK